MNILARTLFALVLLCALPGAGQAELEKGLFSTRAFAWPERPAVPFSHERHVAATASCLDCHHDYRQDGGVRANVFNGQGDIACASCHQVGGNGPKAKTPLRAALHQSCLGCHEGLIRNGKKAGPATCTSCHAKSREARHAG